MRIRVIRHPDCEGDDNYGFQVDTLEVVVDGLRAGYLTMVNAPFHRLLDWHGLDAGRTAVQWSARMQGVTSRAFLAGGERLGVEPSVDAETVARQSRLMGARCSAILNGPDLAYHVDRPLVGQIRLYEPGDFVFPIPRLRFVSRKENVPVFSLPTGFRNRQLGLLLYVEGARWQAERGYRLHGSGVQTPEAQRAWASLQRRFPEAVHRIRKPVGPKATVEEAWRTVLCGDQLPPSWLPRGTASLDRETRPAGRLLHTNNLWDLGGGMAGHFIEDDAEAILSGRNPMGGEPTPPTPAAAIRAYGAVQARKAYLSARMEELSLQERALHGCACGETPCIAAQAAPGLK
jgi:hypothetical protein